jgi:hypothetical protein
MFRRMADVCRSPLLRINCARSYHFVFAMWSAKDAES